MKNNKHYYCTNCGFLTEDAKRPNNCPICNNREFSQYDVKLEEWVKKAVQGNLTYPDSQGMDWGHPNSSLSRHVRSAVYNATTRNSIKRPF